MEERHEFEQYFFDRDTLDRLVGELTRFENPCCICAPTVGRELVDRGHPVTILDVDERFAHLPGFRPFDLTRPEWLAERFDVILCDPPFFGPSLRQLSQCLSGLAHHDHSQLLLVGYLQRRADALVSALQSFDVKPTTFEFGYETVAPIEKNRTILFANYEHGLG